MNEEQYEDRGPVDGQAGAGSAVRDAGPTVTRRGFLQTAVAVAGVASAPLAQAQGASGRASAGATESATASPGLQRVTLSVNGQSITLQVDPRLSLLDALRETIGLTGTKKGCDRGQCGACTVMVDGRRINACLSLAVMNDGRQITTVEGLASGDRLSPLQAAFIEYDGFQCGFCTPGQLCSATAALTEMKAGSVSAATPDVRATRIAINDEELRERMSGNLCRCGAYPNILRAMRSVIADSPVAALLEPAEPIRRTPAEAAVESTRAASAA